MLRNLDRSKFILKLAVIDTRAAAYLDDLPDDIEFIDLQCKRVRFAIFKIIKLIWQLRPQVVFSTLGHLNLLLSALKIVLPRNIRYLGRETTIPSEVVKNIAHPQAWIWAYKRLYGALIKLFANRSICAMI